MKKRTKNEVIHIRMTDEEFEIISRNAAKSDMSISAYIRFCGFGPNIVNVDFNQIEDHTRFIANRLVNIARILDMVQHTYEGGLLFYHQRDIDNFLYEVKEIHKTQSELVKTMKNERAQLLGLKSKAHKNNLLDLIEYL